MTLYRVHTNGFRCDEPALAVIPVLKETPKLYFVKACAGTRHASKIDKQSERYALTALGAWSIWLGDMHRKATFHRLELRATFKHIDVGLEALVRLGGTYMPLEEE